MKSIRTIACLAPTLTAFALFLLPARLSAAALLEEGFNYAEGSLTSVSSPNWNAHSGAGSNPAQVLTTAALSFPALTAIGGKGVAFGHRSASSEDVNRSVAGMITTDGNSVYASCLFRVDSITTIASGADATFLIFSNSTDWPSRMMIKADTSVTTYALGASAAAPTTVAYGTNTQNLNVGTTYFVVISSDFIAGATNNTSRIWVNPATGLLSAPAADATATNTGAEVAVPVGIGIRQGANQRLNMVIDEIRVGNTWADVTPSSAGVENWSLY